MTWKWWLAMFCVLGAFIAAGQIVAAQTREQKSAIEENRDALITVCATMDTLAFVFEQLQFLDNGLAMNPSLDPSVRNDIRSRAGLYGTAVEALGHSDRECEQVE